MSKNEIQHWLGVNRWNEYTKEEWRTPPSTNVDGLTDEEIKLIDTALNKQFVNPKFKMKYFTAESQLTPFHKMRQYLLELRAIEESVENMEAIIEQYLLQEEIANLKKEAAQDPIEKKEWELQALKAMNEVRQAKRRVAQNYIERAQFIDLLKEFLDSDESKDENGRSLMEVLDTPEEDMYEAEYWTARLAKQAAMDMQSYGKIMSGNMESITMLPPDQQTEIISIATDYNLQSETHQLAIRDHCEKRLQLENNTTKQDDSNVNNQTEEKLSLGGLKDVYGV
jgi:hypothetical protein